MKISIFWNITLCSRLTINGLHGVMSHKTELFGVKYFRLDLKPFLRRYFQWRMPIVDKKNYTHTNMIINTMFWYTTKIKKRNLNLPRNVSYVPLPLLRKKLFINMSGVLTTNNTRRWCNKMALIFSMWKRYINEWTRCGPSTACVDVGELRQPKVSSLKTEPIIPPLFMTLTIRLGWKRSTCISEISHFILVRVNDNMTVVFLHSFRPTPKSYFQTSQHRFFALSASSHSFLNSLRNL
jgi:hypothetical protein